MEMLRLFFAKQNMHNRVQLRKQLSDFELETGGDLIAYLMQFDLSEDYDSMVRIIEATSGVTLLDVKEMLRREHEKITRRDKKEAAFKASFSLRKPRSARNDGDFDENSQNWLQLTSQWQRGASCHMSGMFDDFGDYRQLDTPISVMCQVYETAICPAPGERASIGAHVDCARVLIQLDFHGTSLMIDEKVIARIPRIGKMYIWHVGQHALMSQANASEELSGGGKTWHARLGHVLQTKVKLLTESRRSITMMMSLLYVTAVLEAKWWPLRLLANLVVR
ncbi:uncharacterized protein PHALS_12702 [Plasmopara halstedii]|uniref:Uncharacterized protein n=1 Tax=Plasmopara halstedii TaxID=4781 RepID=A0A0P1AM50_PLAHL|nr:uncharacterized protein PHALS_12702 [Plasmopara halstedii]CEG42424.1 hypothetical protein PHALS_12702 [Plasmopara halstedii]|eukprot:XP_024578793.1 hypothetical protein PHALS_12702 [Plasmopara halstedii]